MRQKFEFRSTEWGRVILEWRHNKHGGVCSNVCSGADQGKHQSSSSLAFVWRNHRWEVDSPHKGPVTKKMFPIDDVIIVEAEFIVNTNLPENIHCKVAFSPSRTVMGLCVEYISFGALFIVVVCPENRGHWRWVIIGLLTNQNCFLRWRHQHAN